MCINLPRGEKMVDHITVSVFVDLGFTGSTEQISVYTPSALKVWQTLLSSSDC